jgi:beta-galactosidase
MKPIIKKLSDEILLTRMCIPVFYPLFFFLFSTYLFAQSSPREKLLMDKDWKFNFGHSYKADKDFGHGIAYFSYYAKAGFADGAASPNFDDRAWRKLDLPHDWAVEAPFDPKGSLSHGYKAIGRNFPERSVGWYRKTFLIPKSDDGKKIFVEFDGIFRNSIVWINGHYLGIEPSGYSSFTYDLTDYLNYGGENVLAVRVDATMEEGWFYEGAGIYRHAWLLKTDPLHIDYNGAFVSSEVKNNSAVVKVKAAVVNDGKIKKDFTLEHIIVNAGGKRVDSVKVNNLSLPAGESYEFPASITVNNPALWSLENPYLYKMITRISSEGKIADEYETTFGIRTVRWDPDKGFFLNGVHVRLHGTNNHQDHAGVGSAIPDELQRFRIMKLKETGCNAYRCSHNPPTPEMLKACDEMGMLVIDENRLMGTSSQILKELKRMIVRDRNHPSIIIWSLGNEEWGIEGAETGARIASTMQEYARRLDSTRLHTVAVSGGWGKGISTVLDVMGYNYIGNGGPGSTDRHHKEFPAQPAIGTEECATFVTRGVYIDDKDNGHLNSYDSDPSTWGSSAEEGWGHYAKREYLSGMFVWSGFDYRGEPTPFTWPAICSQFGILDMCGFPKDNAYYYKSWWSSSPMVHLFPHWNWKDGEKVKVWCYSNCEEAELFLNGKTMGRKKIEKALHAEWSVSYVPGTLAVKGYNGGKEVASETVQTTEKGKMIRLQPHKEGINADGEDLTVITVSELDANKRFVPDANDEMAFTIQGPGKIIGVGNGDPSSHETDKYAEDITAISVIGWKVKAVDSKDNRPEVSVETDDSGWATGFTWDDDNLNKNYTAKVYRGKFEMPEKTGDASVMLFMHSLGNEQNVYLNGKPLLLNLAGSASGHEIKLDASMLKAGKNIIAIVATPYKDKRKGGELPASIQIAKPAGQWKRKLFNGLAQVIVQSTGEPGDIVLKAVSGNMTAEIKIPAKPAKVRASVK